MKINRIYEDTEIKNDDINAKSFDLVQEEIKKLALADKNFKCKDKIEEFNTQLITMAEANWKEKNEGDANNSFQKYVSGDGTLETNKIKGIAKELYDNFAKNIIINICTKDTNNVPNNITESTGTMNFEIFIKLNELKIGEPKIPDIFLKKPIKIGKSSFSLKDAYEAGQKSVLDITTRNGKSVKDFLNSNIGWEIPTFDMWKNK